MILRPFLIIPIIATKVNHVNAESIIISTHPYDNFA